MSRERLTTADRAGLRRVPRADRLLGLRRRARRRPEPPSARRPRSAQQQSAVRSGGNGTQPEMLLGRPKSARCVQRFDDSLNPAIRTTYRISLRSSSLREPRHSLLGVVLVSRCATKRTGAPLRERSPTKRARRAQRPAAKPRSRAAERWNACAKERRDGDRRATRKGRALLLPRKRRAR